MEFHFARNEISYISVSGLNLTTVYMTRAKRNSFRGLFHVGQNDRNEISFRVDFCHVNTRYPK